MLVGHGAHGGVVRRDFVLRYHRYSPRLWHQQKAWTCLQIYSVWPNLNISCRSETILKAVPRLHLQSFSRRNIIFVWMKKICCCRMFSSHHFALVHNIYMYPGSFLFIEASLLSDSSLIYWERFKFCLACIQHSSDLLLIKKVYN